jgi:hypothetical protein
VGSDRISGAAAALGQHIRIRTRQVLLQGETMLVDERVIRRGLPVALGAIFISPLIEAAYVICTVIGV